jgi:hypothetical protein
VDCPQGQVNRQKSECSSDSKLQGLSGLGDQIPYEDRKQHGCDCELQEGQHCPSPFIRAPPFQGINLEQSCLAFGRSQLRPDKFTEIIEYRPNRI